MTELEQLRRRVEALEEREAKRLHQAHLTRRWAGGLSAVVALMGATLAWAANGNCPNGYPFCFTADTPVVASEVNHNFSQIKEWVETKVGAVTTQAITATTGTFSGAVSATGNITTSNTLSATTVNATNASLSGSLTAGSATITTNHTVNGDISADSNTPANCDWTGPTCGPFTCTGGRFVAGLDLYENENCGGSGDYDFQPFQLLCCDL